MTLIRSSRLNRFFRCLPAAVALVAASAVAFAQVEELKLTVGKSIVLDYPADIRQISTSDPAVVDAIAVTTREMLLHGKGNGVATIIVWSKTGQRTIYSITVEQNLDPLRNLMKETFPNESIHIGSSRDSIALTGNVSTKDIADRAVALASGFGKAIVNNLKVAVAPVDRQIILRVKFAELNRNVSQSFGLNLVSTGGNTIGTAGTGQFANATPTTLRSGSSTNFTITDTLNIFAFRPDLNLGAFIKALQQQGVLQILAEPNLVTSNGKEASFLVGGEFPVPVLQGGGNAGAVTIQFREFGIRLNFNPLLTENNTIKMHVKPEVSTIDLANAVSLSGFLIPALATRRIESDVELGIGQSFVIGGLLDERVTETMAKIPGLANIPLLGQLFKSRDERRNRTELIVVVTPELVEPMKPGQVPVPAWPYEFLGPYDPSKMSLKIDPKDKDKVNAAAKVAPATQEKAGQ